MSTYKPWWEDSPIVEIHQWPLLSSTHACAMNWPREVLNTHWIWLLAEQQVCGVGQQGRRFVSPLGGLYATLICQWPQEILGNLFSLAVAWSMIAELPLDLYLKWPNDIVNAKGAKVGGVLIERSQTCIISLGLNVNACPRHNVLDRAISSLQEESGHEWDVYKVWQQWQQRLLDTLRLMIHEGTHSFLPALNSRLMGYGASVTVRTNKGLYHGMFHGVDAEGAVLLDHRVIPYVFALQSAF